MKYIKKSIQVLFIVVLLVLLYLSSLYNYLLFHSLAEGFSICIAATVFFITWNSRNIIKNNYLLIIGMAYLFIGFLDFFHTLSYKGMAIFKDYDYYANQLWVAARFFESIVLLFSFLMVKSKKRVNLGLLLCVYTAVTVLSMLSIFVWKVFPIAYIDGVGLTPFKKISEYIICAIILAAIFALRSNKSHFEENVNRYLVISMALTILTELCFTEYVSNYGFMNLLGHYLKIASFYLIYKAIIQTGIKAPYNLIFREMKEAEGRLLEQNQLLSKQTVADNLTIREHITLLQDQYKILNRQSKMLELSHEAIFAREFGGTITYWNRGAELLYGYTAEEAVGRISHELLKTKHSVPLDVIEGDLLRYGVWTGEISHTTKDGRTLTIDTTHQNYEDEGKSRVVLEINRDVTDRRAMEIKLSYQNNLLNAILESMQDALVIFDGTGDVTQVNARARDMYQVKPSSDKTMIDVISHYRVFTLDRRQLSIDQLPGARVRRGETVRAERFIMEGDGWSRFVETNALPISDKNGQLSAIVVIHHDITDLINKQQEIETQNALLTAVIENMHDALFIFDREGIVKYMNAVARAMYEVNPTDKTTVIDVTSDNNGLTMDGRTIAREDFPARRALRGEIVRNERLISKNDRWNRIIEVNAIPIADARGGISNVVVTHHDISDIIRKQQQIEEHLVQLQQQNKTLSRQSQLLDLSHEAILSWYMDGPIIYWNQGAQKMYGFSDDEAVGISPQLLLGTRFPFDVEELYKVLRETGFWSGYIEHTAKDGRSLIAETRMQLITNNLGLSTILETNRDVTEKIKAENAVRKNAVELRTIIDSTNDFIWSVDADYNIIFCNKSVYDFTLKNYGIELNPGVPLLKVLPTINAESFYDFFERAKNEGEFSVDTRSFRGDRFICYTFHAVHFDGEFIGITVFGRDITERSRAEQEIFRLNTSLEDRIQERTKELRESMNTIRNLTLMVTHDLKTPLLEIGDYARQIRERQDIDQNADKISDLSADMNGMIGELLDYDKISSAEISKESVDLQSMFETVFNELKTGSAVLEFETGMPRISADKKMMRRFAKNIISNALKFSAMRQQPTLVAGCQLELDHYVFYLKDNGIGFDMAYAGKLFNVFERLHDSSEFEGHGIGLASCRSIIAKHNGSIWLQGKPGAGATVFFTLPAVKDIGADNV